MNKKLNLDRLLNEQGYYSTDDESYLTEDEACIVLDNRTWSSNIEDIDGGDNFADYCEYIYGILEEEDYFES